MDAPPIRTISARSSRRWWPFLEAGKPDTRHVLGVHGQPDPAVDRQERTRPGRETRRIRETIVSIRRTANRKQLSVSSTVRPVADPHADTAPLTPFQSEP